MFPAAVIFTGVANTGTALIRASSENEATAVAARIAVADEPAEVPTAIVAAPPEVQAVVEFTVPATITALSGSDTVPTGVIVDTAPASVVKL